MPQMVGHYSRNVMGYMGYVDNMDNVDKFFLENAVFSRSVLMICRFVTVSPFLVSVLCRNGCGVVVVMELL